MIRWLCGHISPTASSQGRYSRWRDPVRPDGNNVDGPSHATYRDCTTASRSNSPNYKIIILRLAPPGNTRDQPGLYSPLGLVRHVLRALPSFLFTLLFTLLLFSVLFILPFLSFIFSFHPPTITGRVPSGSRRSSLIRRSDAAHVYRERSLSPAIGIISNWLTLRPYLVSFYSVLQRRTFSASSRRSADNYSNITVPVVSSQKICASLGIPTRNASSSIYRGYRPLVTVR